MISLTHSHQLVSIFHDPQAQSENGSQFVALSIMKLFQKQITLNRFIEKGEYSKLYDYLKAKKVKITSGGTAGGKINWDDRAEDKGKI